MQAQRRTLRALTAGAVLLLLGSVAWFAWHERRQELDGATELSVRRAARLAGELGETLALAEVAIAQIEAVLPRPPAGTSLAAALAETSVVQARLLASLPLPFELHALDAAGGVIDLASGHPPGRPDLGRTGPQLAASHKHPMPTAGGQGWQVGSAVGPPGARYVPLVRRAAPNPHGIAAYAADLHHAPLVQRFEQWRVPQGGGVALFRLEPDGSTTTLARAPPVEALLGRTVRGPLAEALARQRTGSFRDLTQLDNTHRLVAYHRLEGDAAQLVVGYGMATDLLLADWNSRTRWLAGIALLVAAGMVAGGRRLDRSLLEVHRQQQAVARSESHFRALAGNLPDVVVRMDREGRHLYANAAVQQATGMPPEALIGKTNAELGMPTAILARWLATLEQVFASGRTARLEFDYPGPEGQRRWESLIHPEPVPAGVESTVLVISRDITERQRAEAERRAADERFEKLFVAAPESISLAELDSGRLLQVNDAFCAMFGVAREEAIGRTSFEIGMWTQMPGRAGIVERVRAGERVRGLEGRVRHRSGIEVDVLVSAERVQFGGSDCLLLMLHDVTERNRLQAAVWGSEARLAHLVRHAPVVIYTARPGDDYGATYYSPNLPGLLGWTPEQFVREPRFWLDHLHPDDRTGVLARLEDLPGRGELVLEYRFRHADGRWRWMRDAVSVQRGSDGAAVELVGSLIDITERREAEEQVRGLAAQLEQRVQERTAQLAQSEARYRTIFETVPVSIGEEDWSGVMRLLRELRAGGVSDGAAHFAAQPDFVRQCLRAVRVVRMNRKMLALHEAEGRAHDLPSLDAFYPEPEDQSQFVGELEAMWAGERIYAAKRTLPSLRGRPLNLMMTISLPALDGDDADESDDATALVCLVDISELDRLNAELDRSVVRLREVNKELETFTYSVSHDLKAPLRGIDGYSRLLLSDHAAALDDEGRQFLGHIRRATQHMGVLIDDLLAYSRLERREIRLAPLPVAAVVQQVLAASRQELAASNAVVDAVIDVRVDAALRATGDVQGLTMALRNLVDNAFKFTRDSRPARITVGAEAAQGRVRIWVRDNGVGFDMKFHDRIFAIFQRLNRAEEYPGTGVGLAIVRKAMERMGGRAWAESAPGEGATFHLELPEAPR